MLFGPMIGNAINLARNLGKASENAVLTTDVIPAPEIFLAGAAREITTPEIGTFLYGY